MNHLPLQTLPVVRVKVRVGMQGESLQEGAPGLLSGRGPDVHLRPAQPHVSDAGQGLDPRHHVVLQLGPQRAPGGSEGDGHLDRPEL